MNLFNVKLKAGDLEKQAKYLEDMETVLAGLVKFAEIRDEEDAGDWVVVVNTADLAKRYIKDVKDNIRDIAESICDDANKAIKSGRGEDDESVG